MVLIVPKFGSAYYRRFLHFDNVTYTQAITTQRERERAREISLGAIRDTIYMAMIHGRYARAGLINIKIAATVRLGCVTHPRAAF